MRRWIRKAVPVAMSLLLLGATAGMASAANDYVTSVQVTPQNPTSFDISWFDPATGSYYLSDRTNKAIDVVQGTTLTNQIGAGLFVGASPNGPNSSGPNGVVTAVVYGSVYSTGSSPVTELWAGDGNSTVKAFNLSAAGDPMIYDIPTGGTHRADELSYDPTGQVVLIANDADSPPFLSFINAQTGIVTQHVYYNGTAQAAGTIPQALDGLEQSVWDPQLNAFLQNVPQVPSPGSTTWMGQVDEYQNSGGTWKLVHQYAVPGCSPAGMALDPNSGNIVIGCSSDAMSGDSYTVGGQTYTAAASPASTVIMNAATGGIVATLHQVGGSDEVWYNSGDDRYYVAASSMTSNGTASGAATPVLGVIDAATNQWDANIPTVRSAHSVAVDPANNDAYVPEPSGPDEGIAIFNALPLATSLNVSPAGSGTADVTVDGTGFGTVAGSVYLTPACGGTPTTVAESTYADTSVTASTVADAVYNAVYVAVYNAQTGALSNSLYFGGLQPTATSCPTGFAGGGGGGGGGGGVSSTTTGNSVGSGGGTLTCPDGDLTATIPAGSVPAGDEISCQSSTTAPSGAPALPSDMAALSDYFTIDGGVLTTPVTATINYDSSGLGGLSQNRVSVFHDGMWEYLPTAVQGSATTAKAFITGDDTYAVLGDTEQFSDVATNYWARSNIDTLLGAGIIVGFPNGTFQPDAAVTRAQFVKMLVLTMGLTPGSGSTSFADVQPTDWFAPYVSAAVSAGLVYGTSPTTFSPSAVITREQMAVLLARAMKLSGSANLTFTDASSIDSWALAGVQSAVAAGYIVGFPDGTFQPFGSTTRAQASKVLSLIIAQEAPGGTPPSNASATVGGSSNTAAAGATSGSSEADTIGGGYTGG